MAQQREQYALAVAHARKTYEDRLRQVQAQFLEGFELVHREDVLGLMMSTCSIGERKEATPRKPTGDSTRTVLPRLSPHPTRVLC